MDWSPTKLTSRPGTRAGCRAATTGRGSRQSRLSSRAARTCSLIVCAAPPPPAAYGAAAMVDLIDEIDFKASEVLNAKGGSGALGNAFKQGLRDQDMLLTESDADEQLLVTIKFKSKVKLHSIVHNLEMTGADIADIVPVINILGSRRQKSLEVLHAGNSAVLSLELVTGEGTLNVKLNWYGGRAVRKLP